MEQYAHLLIASDPDFAPDPARVSVFFDLVQEDFRLHYVKSKENYLPGLMAMTSVEEVRTMRNAYTGEKETYKTPKWFEVQQTSEIQALVGAEPKFGVRMSGKWSQTDVPIEMLVADGTTLSGDLTCLVACAKRAQAVCTGDWWGEAHGGDSEFDFDNPESPLQSDGVFTHPWTGGRIELADAGSARFWIELEFGKWIIPKMKDSFDLLRPEFISAVENCFGTRFIQAGRGIA
jgi:hypothetical protein